MKFGCVYIVNCNLDKEPTVVRLIYKQIIYNLD